MSRPAGHITPTRNTPDRLTRGFHRLTEPERELALGMYNTTTLTYAQAAAMIAAEPGGAPACGMRHDTATIECLACGYSRNSDTNVRELQAREQEALTKAGRLRERLSRATAFAVCVLPFTHPEFGKYAVTVQWCGGDRWSAGQGGFQLSADGSWDWVPPGREQDSDWKAAHRFDLDSALRLAEQAAPDVPANGITATQALKGS